MLVFLCLNFLHKTYNNKRNYFDKIIMKMIDSKNLNINDIPLKYHLDSFNQFALSFDPQNDSATPYFIHIPISQPLSNLDHVVSIRVLLYSIQRILNNRTYESDEFKPKIEKSYQILRLKLQKHRE